MKHKIIIPVLLIFLLNQKVFSQMMLSAKIHGKGTPKEYVEDKPVKVTIKKSDYKNVCNFDVLVEQKDPTAAYKRTIEFTDENGIRLYSVDESKETPGVYTVGLAGICKELASKKIIKVIFLENPANDMLMLPSKMKQLAEIHLQ